MTACINRRNTEGFYSVASYSLELLVFCFAGCFSSLAKGLERRIIPLSTAEWATKSTESAIESNCL